MELPGSGKMLTLSDFKQFLIEAELANQPVFRLEDKIYFFTDGDVMMCYVKKENEEDLEEWNRRMVKNANKEKTEKVIIKKKRKDN